MRRARAIGANKISMEFWKNVCEVSVEWLIGLFNVIFRTIGMLKE